MIRPFTVSSLSQLVAVTASASASTTLPGRGNTLRVVNSGTKTAYIAVGAGAQVAIVTTATPSASATAILGGEDCAFTIPSDAVLNISAIAGSGDTTSLIVQVGEGG